MCRCQACFFSACQPRSTFLPVTHGHLRTTAFGIELRAAPSYHNLYMSLNTAALFITQGDKLIPGSENHQIKRNTRIGVDSRTNHVHSDSEIIFKNELLSVHFIFFFFF